MTHITLTTKIGDIFQLPEIGELSSYLIYCLKKDIWLDEHVKRNRGEAAYGGQRRINWSPGGIQRAWCCSWMNLKEAFETTFYLYRGGGCGRSAEEKVCLLEFQPENRPDRPVILLAFRRWIQFGDAQSCRVSRLPIIFVARGIPYLH